MANRSIEAQIDDIVNVAIEAASTREAHQVFQKHIACPVYVLSTRFKGGPQHCPQEFRRRGWTTPEDTVSIVAKLMTREIFGSGGGQFDHDAWARWVINGCNPHPGPYCFCYTPNENNAAPRLAGEPDDVYKKRCDDRWLLAWRFHAKAGLKKGGACIRLLPRELGPSLMMMAEEDMAHDMGLRVATFEFSVDDAAPAREVALMQRIKKFVVDVVTG